MYKFWCAMDGMGAREFYIWVYRCRIRSVRDTDLAVWMLSSQLNIPEREEGCLRRALRVLREVERGGEPREGILEHEALCCKSSFGRRQSLPSKADSSRLKDPDAFSVSVLEVSVGTPNSSESAVLVAVR